MKSGGIFTDMRIQYDTYIQYSTVHDTVQYDNFRLRDTVLGTRARTYIIIFRYVPGYIIKNVYVKLLLLYFYCVQYTVRSTVRRTLRCDFIRTTCQEQA